MNEAIIEMATRYEEDSFFTRTGFTDEARKTAECTLGVSLPNQYVEYLETFGHGGVAGVEILGIGHDGSLIFVEQTMLYRKYGLPKNLVAIENQDEWLMCADCNTGKIVSWSRDEDALFEYDSFDDFIIDEFQEAIDNL